LTTTHATTSYTLLCNYAHPISFFFFNDTATTQIYTLSLHDALPIYQQNLVLLQHLNDPLPVVLRRNDHAACALHRLADHRGDDRSEEHTSELQSRSDLVCRLLLEKKK